MLSIAVLGMGWAGTRHVEAIRELGRKVAVDCLVDNDAAFLANKTAELGVEKTYTDVRDALADPAVDAVSICLPHNLHRPVALAAAEAGKHILCEKPIALTVAGATEMIQAAEAYGVTLYVAENVPYSGYSRFLRHVVESGEHVGEITFARMVRGFQALAYGYPGRRAWLSTPAQGGSGTWMLHGIHSMAQLRYVFGEVKTVYMQAHRISAFERPDLEGTMSGLFTMQSGIHISVVQTCETRLGDYLKGITIYGEKGTLHARPTTCEVFPAGGAPEVLTIPKDDLSTYAQEIEAFAEAIAGIRVGPTTARSERRSLAVVQAGYESARSGKPVNLEARFGPL